MTFLIAAGTPPTLVTAMGMNKNGNQAVAGNSGSLKLLGWVARPGYSDTVLVDDALVAKNPGRVTVRSQFTLTTAWQTEGKLWMSIMLNTTEVQSIEFTANQKVATLDPLSLTMAAGDRLWAQSTNSTLFSDTTVQGGAGTYLYCDPA